MRTSQIGDRVQAHYTKRFEDGSIRSSRFRGNKPLELTVGNAHPGLPGVATNLVGLEVGQKVKVQVSAAEAYGLPDPTRTFRVDRARFRSDETFEIGSRVTMQLRRGRTRQVRILEVLGKTVVIDGNHPRCGQPMELELELVAFLTAVSEADKMFPRLSSRD
jgi:FKBP-type peptidyl-prolyl cis-trans isomerase SlpA